MSVADVYSFIHMVTRSQLTQSAMAYVECNRLQKDDIIVHPRRANRLGVVCQTSHDVSESEDEEWDRFSGELHSGQARVYWFPSGRVSVVPENVGVWYS